MSFPNDIVNEENEDLNFVLDFLNVGFYHVGKQHTSTTHSENIAITRCHDRDDHGSIGRSKSCLISGHQFRETAYRINCRSLSCVLRIKAINQLSTRIDLRLRRFYSP